MSKTVRLEVFAEMSARIAGGEPRAEVLAAASADDAQFEASQAFWLGRMSDEARNGRGTLAQRYADLFAAAQKTLSAPKKPERRVWRMMAPAKVAFATPNASVASASSAVPLAPGVATGPHTARLTLEQFAAFRADLVVAPEAEHPAVRERFGLDAVTWAREEAHWQSAFAGDPDLFQRYLRQFKYCKALLEPRG